MLLYHSKNTENQLCLWVRFPKKCCTLQKETILKYEHAMYKFEFHTVMNLMDTYIRDANKFLGKNIKDAEADTEKRNQVLIDTLHMVKPLWC